MKKNQSMLVRFSKQVAFIVIVFVSHLQLAAQTGPILSVATLANQQLRLSWPANAGVFALQQASSLSNPVSWQVVGTQPQVDGSEYFV
jgi:hypothetical protein